MALHPRLLDVVWGRFPRGRVYKTILRAARSRRPAGAAHQPITDFPSGWVLPLTTARVHEFLAGWGTVWELHPLKNLSLTERTKILWTNPIRGGRGRESNPVTLMHM